MATGNTPRTAALLALAFIVPRVFAQGPPIAYSPSPERLEILKSWEKQGGRAPPELVAGIYEFDYRRYDFQNKIAITIDDIVPNKYLAMDLDILKSRGIKAVFFIIGSYLLDARGKPMPRAKELLDRIVNEGHVIGSHSYWHRRMDSGEFRDRAAVDRELDRNQATIDMVLGYHYPLSYFRPPNGAHSSPGYPLDHALRGRGQYLTNWTITSFDWCMRLPPEHPDHLGAAQVIARTVKQANEESGGVVLLHCFPATSHILDDLLGALAAASNKRGPLVFSTLDEIMRLKYGTGQKAAP
jgi:peptidoglycan/xylan/chitin deacetylase (PgdA/CDA1 family)